MLCWSCKKTLDDPPDKKIGFRATCEFCHAYLHCCKNCRFYKPGQPNDCLISGTDPISDRSQVNFCDEFSLNKDVGKQQESSDTLKDVSKKLFGEDVNPKKKGFDDLF